MSKQREINKHLPVDDFLELSDLHESVFVRDDDTNNGALIERSFPKQPTLRCLSSRTVI